MKTRVLNIFLVLFVCVMTSFSQERIIGGYPVDISQRPFQAAIYCGTQFGGGVIIDSQWILTAAHVVKNENNITFLPSSVQVSTGYTDLTTDMYGKIQASEIIVHPNYNSTTYDNDIALVKLSTPLIFGTSRQPVILATYAPGAGTNAVISGWGRRSIAEGSGSHRQLYATNVTIQSSTSTQIVAKASPEMPFKGDSGGPLTISEPKFENQLIGLASWVYSNNPTSQSVHYTNVGNYSSWIKSHTGISQPFISGSRLVIYKSQYSVDNLPVGASVSWSINNGQNKATVDGQGFVSPNLWYTGYTTLDAKINVPWGQQYQLSRDIFIGFPEFHIILHSGDEPQGPSYMFKTNTHYLFMADPKALGPGREHINFNFIWKLRDGSGMVIDSRSLYNCGCLGSLFPVNIATPGNYTLEVYVTGLDYGSGTYTRSLTFGTPMMYSILFNSATNEIVIQQKSKALKVLTHIEDKDYIARLYNNSRLLRSVSFQPEEKSIIDVSSLSNGTYYLVIMEGNKVIQSQIVLINH